jgi:hypothetical protein
MAYISVDFEIDEVLSSLWKKSDRLELLEGLLEVLDPEDVLSVLNSNSEYTDKTNRIKPSLSGDDSKFAEACEIINVNRWRLDLEDEQYILNLANKL